MSSDELGRVGRAAWLASWGDEPDDLDWSELSAGARRAYSAAAEAVRDAVLAGQVAVDPDYLAVLEAYARASDVAHYAQGVYQATFHGVGSLSIAQAEERNKEAKQAFHLARLALRAFPKWQVMK